MTKRKHKVELVEKENLKKNKEIQRKIKHNKYLHYWI